MAVIWRADKSLLKQPFGDDVDALLRDDPDTWVVTYGYRSLALQAELYAKYQAGGPRAAPPGKSAHNYGLAVDIVLDGSPAPGIQPDWNTSNPAWVRLFAAVDAHPRLHSGRSFNDADHIEAVHWAALI